MESINRTIILTKIFITSYQLPGDGTTCYWYFQQIVEYFATIIFSMQHTKVFSPFEYTCAYCVMSVCIYTILV